MAAPPDSIPQGHRPVPSASQRAQSSEQGGHGRGRAGNLTPAAPRSALQPALPALPALGSLSLVPRLPFLSWSRVFPRPVLGNVAHPFQNGPSARGSDSALRLTPAQARGRRRAWGPGRASPAPACAPRGLFPAGVSPGPQGPLCRCPARLRPCTTVWTHTRVHSRTHSHMHTRSHTFALALASTRPPTHMYSHTCVPSPLLRINSHLQEQCRLNPYLREIS